jgi:1-acyl-sn-glycerol-3-phosphate acyltransferase
MGKDSIMRKIRDVFYLLLICLYTLVLGIPAILLTFLYPGGNLSYLIGRLWAWLILKTLGVKVEVKGLEHLKNLKSFIIMANHQSHLDVASIMATFPHQLRFLAKKELTRIPVFGWAMFLQGHLVIEREKRESAFKTIDLAAEKVKRGKKLVVFPEGTRSDGNSLLPFKKGGFVLAIKSGAPIVPVSIYGTHKILPRKSLRLGEGKRVKILVHPPVETSYFTMENKETLMNLIRTKIEDGIKALSDGNS